MKKNLAKNNYLLLINVILIIAAAVIALKTITPLETAKKAYSSASYYIIFALVAAWVLQWIYWMELKSISFGSLLRREWKNILFCLLVAGIVFVSVKPYFRILADETNLVAVSKSMIYDHGIDNSTMGKWYYGNYNSFSAEAPTRPLLFPFLVHLLHAVTGYHVFNVFLANYLFFAALLFMVLYLFSKEYGPAWGVAAVFAVCAQPVVIQTATSGGFDLLNLVFALLVFFTLKLFLIDGTAETFSLLWITGLMFSHVRYESMVFFAMIPVLLLLMRKIRWQYFQSSLVYGLTPIFILPLVWGKIYYLSLKDPFQTKGQDAFGLKYVLINCKNFFQSFFLPDPLFPYSVIVNWLAAAGLILIGFRMISRKHDQPDAKNLPLLIITALFIISYLSFTFYWGAGWAKHPSTSRYFVIYAAALSLIAVMGLEKIAAFKTRPVLAVLLMAGLFCFYQSRNIEDRFIQTQILPRQYTRALDFIMKQDTKNLVIITDRPGMYTVHNFGAASFGYANQHSKQLLSELRRHLFQDIFVIQEIGYKTQAPASNTRLDQSFILETLYEFQNAESRYIRISKVKL